MKRLIILIVAASLAVASALGAAAADSWIGNGSGILVQAMVTTGLAVVAAGAHAFGFNTVKQAAADGAMGTLLVGSAKTLNKGIVTMRYERLQQQKAASAAGVGPQAPAAAA